MDGSCWGFFLCRRVPNSVCHWTPHRPHFCVLLSGFAAKLNSIESSYDALYLRKARWPFPPSMSVHCKAGPLTRRPPYRRKLTCSFAGSLSCVTMGRFSSVVWRWCYGSPRFPRTCVIPPSPIFISPLPVQLYVSCSPHTLCDSTFLEQGFLSV